MIRSVMMGGRCGAGRPRRGLDRHTNRLPRHRIAQEAAGRVSRAKVSHSKGKQAGRLEALTAKGGGSNEQVATVQDL